MDIGITTGMGGNIITIPTTMRYITTGGIMTMRGER
jgi:hypothetical protein